MKSSFVFKFDNSRKTLCRTYGFDLEFINNAAYERCLDWAERSDDILLFLQEMEHYGSHEVEYNPATEFYGLESGNINPKNYIKVMELWRDFFVEHNIECGDIVEVIDDKLISFGG